MNTESIFGLVPVNGGIIKPFKNSKVEILNRNISGHLEYLIVSYASEGQVKVSMCYDGNAFYISRFRNAKELQHYWSTSKQLDEVMTSKKYRELAIYTIEAYKYFAKYYKK